MPDRTDDEEDRTRAEASVKFPKGVSPPVGGEGEVLGDAETVGAARAVAFFAALPVPSPHDSPESLRQKREEVHRRLRSEAAALRLGVLPDAPETEDDAL